MSDETRQLVEQAEGVLAQWLTGYTDHFEDGQQRKIEDHGEGWFAVYHCEDGRPRPEGVMYRIKVSITRNPRG